MSHDLTIIAARYVIERLSVADATALSGRIGNCTLTTYAGGGERLELRGFNRPVTDDGLAAAEPV